MKIKTGHKVSLFLVLTITAVVFCTLPFLAVKKDTVYVYTQSPYPISKEKGFIRELQRLGFNVIVNSSKKPKKDAGGIWFKDPEYLSEIIQSLEKIKFLYTEAYYPINGQGISENMPVILTPYQNLYEHYMRSNIKAAQFTLGVDLTDFYQRDLPKKYIMIYYGDNNKTSPIAESLKEKKDVKFIGNFWEKRENVLSDAEADALERGKALASTHIVSIYNAPDSAQSQKIPQEIMEATASGALVFSSPNQAVENLYGDNVIIYNNLEDFIEKSRYFIKHKDMVQGKIISANKITAEKMSASASAQRFKELFDWLKENMVE